MKGQAERGEELERLLMTKEDKIKKQEDRVDTYRTWPVAVDLKLLRIRDRLRDQGSTDREQKMGERGKEWTKNRNTSNRWPYTRGAL